MSLLFAPFEGRVQKDPAHPALLWDGGEWSYQRLDREANRLARHMVRRGVGPDVPVALVLDRSPGTVALMLAVLKAGGAWVPLSPSSPEERLRFALADSGAVLAVAPAAVAARLAETDLPVIDVATLEAEAAGENDEPLDARTTADNLAYLIYTSGSTGRPKAVAVSHGAIVNHMEWMQRALPLRPDDVFLQKTVLTFDASLIEVFAPLGAGARLLLAPPGAEKEPHVLVEVLRKQGVTVLQVVPSLLRLLLDEPGVDSLPRLRRLLCGGEPLEPNLLARAAEVLGVEAVNLYGPTETAVEVAWWRAAPGETADPVPVGRPVDGVRLWLAEPDLQSTKEGGTGEIAVTGAALARGYHRRPGLTAERFRPAPNGSPGARTYLTGDLGRWLPGGDLLCLGRRDGQVKLHGLRVELSEVEELLRTHPEVSGAAVDLREDVPGHRLLVAYVVPRHDPSPNAAELRRHLGRHLPEALLPTAFVPLESLPYTPNGKLDRRALPPVPNLQRSSPAEYEEPRGGIEREVAQRMSELLGGISVGRRDDLFELGGNSLLAMRLLARLRHELGREAALADLLAEPTPAGLARRLEAGRPVRGNPLPTIRPRPRDGDRAPAAPAQERVLFVEDLAPGMLAYQFQNAIHLRGRLDIRALTDSLTEICRRHEVYRTTFEMEPQRWVQVIHPPGPAAFTAVDLVEEMPDTTPEERLREAEERIQQEVRHRFDRRRLPLVRWILYRLGADGDGEARWVMLHHEHHLIHDGWAYNLFLEELLATYDALAAGEPSPLPDPPVQFADYAVLQQEWVEGEAAAGQLEWWREHLADLPGPLDLPYDRPRPSEPRFRGRTITRQLSEALSDRLRALARRQGATPYMVLMAGFLTLLHRYSGQEDLPVGSAVANRRWPGCECLYGMLVDNVVVRGDLSGRPTFSTLLDRVRREALAVWERQELPFDRVVREVATNRDTSVNPLFQVMFSFHDSPLPELSRPGLTLELDEGISNGSAKFDMNIVVIPRLEQRSGWRGGADSRRITVIWEANRDLFDAATVDRAFVHLRNLLAAAADDAARPVDLLPVMDGAELQQVATGWSGPPPSPVPEEAIHLQVLARARRTPQAVALIGGERTWTYGELAQRVETLARVLHRAGVGPDVPVGVGLPRTPEMVAAVLAVLAAGGAYLPLDPAFPADRLALMLEDSGTTRVLTRPGVLPAEILEGRTVLPPDPGPATGDGGAPFTPADPHPEGLAYVLYTSGSTGRPKGVEVSHRSVTNFLASMGEAPGLDPDDTLLAVTTLSFDISVLELFLPLVTGARLVLATSEEGADGARLAELLAQHGATVLQGTPATWRMLLDSGWDGDGSLKALCGGEALPPELAEQLLPRVASLWNLYGPTETTVWSAARQVAPGEWPVRVGGVVANTRLHLVDRTGAPVLPGGVGEIHIGGRGVARGYRDRPGLTAERFVPDPHGEPGRRCYRTGDFGRWRNDGTLEFLGRADGQVKVRGFRIEVAEVEAALRTDPALADAVVGVDGEGTDKRLVGWYVAADGATEGVEVDEDRLRSRLAGLLPSYMMPSVLIPIDRVPLTPNGKVDRRALPAPRAAAGDGEVVAPRNELEELLVEEWRELIGCGVVGITDNFFSLGGHSLLATRHVHRLYEMLGVELTVGTLYRHSTIAGLASILEERMAAQIATDPTRLDPGAHGGAEGRHPGGGVE